MSRLWLRQLFCAALVSAATSGAAQAAECSVQRRDYAFNRYFELSEESQPSGTILRQRWRRLIGATYELFDINGNAAGWASTRLLNLGVIFPWARTLDMFGAAGELEYSLRSIWFTVESAVYELTDRQGAAIAHLRIDVQHSGCIVTRPNQKHAVLARLYRNQISDHNFERWDYVTRDDAGVPPQVWQFIAAFFADIWI